MTEKDPQIQKKISELLPILIKDEGKTDIYQLAIDSGFSEEESKKVPFLMATMAKIILAKSKEIAIHSEITRKDVRQNLQTIYNRTMKRLLEITSDPNFDIGEDFNEKIKSFIDLHEKLAKFEGLNKPDKVEVEVSQKVDLSKVSIEDQENLLKLYDKVKIEEE